MNIGEKLQLLRKLKDYTQEEIASKLNMERRSYANLENNTTKIDVSRMNQIAEIYGLEMDEILNFDTKTAFDKCFNKNAETWFPVEKLKTTASDDERFFGVKLSIDKKVIAKARATSKKKAEEIASKRAYFAFQQKIDNK